MGCTSSTADANKVSNIKPQQQQQQQKPNHISTDNNNDESKIKINGQSNHLNGELNEITDIRPGDGDSNKSSDTNVIRKVAAAGDPFAEEAAIKIQSGFRGYQTRKELRKTKIMKEDESTIDRKEQDVNKAATTIQAGFKGYKVRKEYKKQKSENSSEEGSPKKSAAISDEIDQIDLNDPDVEKAATKIQATFRGYKTRKAESSATS